VEGLGSRLVGRVVVWLEVGVLEGLFDGDTLAGREGQAPAHEVEGIGLGLGAHFAQVAAAVEGQGAEVVF